MHRTFIATIIAIALAVTGIASAPARAADTDEFAAILAGLAALAIIASAATDHADTHTQHRSKPKKKPAVAYADPGKVIPRPLPDAAKRGHKPGKKMPGTCMREFDTRGGTHRHVGRACLSRNWGNPDRLPKACASSVKTRKGMRHGYRPGCLRDRGYRIATR